jgi:hypothetical protein
MQNVTAIGTVVVSEEIGAAIPELIEQVIPFPRHVDRVITEAVEEVVPTSAEDDVRAVPLPPKDKIYGFLFRGLLSLSNLSQGLRSLPLSARL